VLLAILFLFDIGTAFSAQVDDHQPLIISMSDDSYPFQYADDEGKAQGLLVDYWRQWARVNQREIMFMPAPWLQSLEDVKQGLSDLHIGMANTDSRQLMFDFEQPISQVQSYLYVHKSLKGLNKVEDATPYNIGVVKGSAHIELLLAKQPKLSFTYFDSRKQLIAAVMANEIYLFASLEGYLRDSVTNQQVMGAFPYRQRIPLDTLLFYPAVKKENGKRLETILAGFSAIDQEVLDGIQRRWLGTERSQSKVIIAMQANMEPYAAIGPNGLPHGLLVDIWKLWSDKTGIPIRFLASDLQGSQDHVSRGIADVQLGYPERALPAKGIERIKLIHQVSHRLFTHNKSFDQLDELNGKVFAVMPEAPYLNELIAALPHSDFRYAATIKEMMSLVDTGQIDGFIAPAAVAQHQLLFSHRWSEFYPFEPLQFNTDLYVLNRSRDTGLSERIITGFNAISQAELARLEAKWILTPQDRIYVADADKRLFSVQPPSIFKDLGSLKVGFVKNWPPMEFKDAQGQYAGVNSDIFKTLSQALGLTLEYIDYNDWQTLLEALMQGEIDMAGSIAPSEQRTEKLIFSGSYWPAPWGLVTSLDNVNLFSLSELKGLRLAVVEGYHIVDDLMQEHPSLELVLVPNTQAGLASVEQGKADAFIDKVINLSAGVKLGQFSNLKMSMLIDFAEQRSHIGVNKHKQHLMPYINRVLASIDRAQQQKIHQKWVSKTMQLAHDSATNDLRLSIIVFGILATCVLIVLLAYWRIGLDLKRLLGKY